LRPRDEQRLVLRVKCQQLAPGKQLLNVTHGSHDKRLHSFLISLQERHDMSKIPHGLAGPCPA
jgi:hypothetical protein